MYSRPCKGNQGYQVATDRSGVTHKVVGYSLIGGLPSEAYLACREAPYPVEEFDDATRAFWASGLDGYGHGVVITCLGCLGGSGG